MRVSKEESRNECRKVKGDHNYGGCSYIGIWQKHGGNAVKSVNMKHALNFVSMNYNKLYSSYSSGSNFVISFLCCFCVVRF